MTYGAFYLVSAVIATFFLLLAAQWLWVNSEQGDRDAAGSVTVVDEASVGTKTVLLTSCLVFWLVAAYFIFIRGSNTLLCTMAHDVFVYYDGAYRVSNGQVPHVDFHTPMGAGCYVIPYWGWKIAGRFAGSLEHTSLLVAALLMGVGVRILASRYWLASSVPLLLFLTLLILVPLNIGETPEQISHSMFYNRYGWAGLTLVFLFFVEPTRISKASNWLDALCLGTLLVFLLYLKITYFLVALVFLPLLALKSPYNRRMVFGALGASAVAAGLLEIVYGLHLPYFRDLAMAIQASGASRSAILASLVYNFREFALVAVSVAMVCLFRKESWIYLACIGYIILAGLAIIDQNTHRTGVICLLAALMISLEVLRRKSPTGHRGKLDRSDHRLAPYFILGLVVLFMAQPLVFRLSAMAIIRSAFQHLPAESPSALEGIVFNSELVRNHEQEMGADHEAAARREGLRGR